MTTNYGDAVRKGEIYFTHGTGRYTLTVTQASDPSLYKGAGSLRAREIAYKTAFITRVSSDSYTRIDDYVGRLKMEYNGQEAGTDHPVVVYLYDIDLSGDVSLAVTCADNDDSSIKATSESTTVLQTVRKQLAAMQADNSSRTVLGGVNGDFFLYDYNNLIQGICHRNGVCLKNTFYNTGNTVFAIRNDGTAVIMNQQQYGELNQQIKEALGGRQRLIHQGSVYGKDCEPYEPRTAVGVSKDRKMVYLLVVDGRQAASYGARYYDMSKFLLAAGAYDAINLDGGGSSSFVEKTSGDGTVYSHYTLLNNPMNTYESSTEREVANGLAIVKNKNQQ